MAPNKRMKGKCNWEVINEGKFSHNKLSHLFQVLTSVSFAQNKPISASFPFYLQSRNCFFFSPLLLLNALKPFHSKWRTESSNGLGRMNSNYYSRAVADLLRLFHSVTFFSNAEKDWPLSFSSGSKSSSCRLKCVHPSISCAAYIHVSRQCKFLPCFMSMGHFENFVRGHGDCVCGHVTAQLCLIGEKESLVVHWIGETVMFDSLVTGLIVVLKIITVSFELDCGHSRKQNNTSQGSNWFIDESGTTWELPWLFGERRSMSGSHLELLHSLLWRDLDLDDSSSIFNAQLGTGDVGSAAFFTKHTMTKKQKQKATLFYSAHNTARKSEAMTALFEKKRT